MAWPRPAEFRDIVIASGVDVVWERGWDDHTLSPYSPATTELRGGLLHHTANGGAAGDAPSLAYCMRGTYPPVRNCNLLTGRSGRLHVLTAFACYHAGAGSPWSGGPPLPADQGNRYLLGNEIESRGTSLDVTAHAGTDGITQAQVDTAAAVAAAFSDALGWPTSHWANHRTWAPGRKTDTLIGDQQWRDWIDARRGGPVALTPEDVEAIWQRTVDVDGKPVKMGAMLVAVYKATRPAAAADEQ